MLIRFFCSKCHKVYAVNTALIGKRALCTNCKNKLVVPSESQISEEEYRSLLSFLAKDNSAPNSLSTGQKDTGTGQRKPILPNADEARFANQGLSPERKVKAKRKGDSIFNGPHSKSTVFLTNSQNVAPIFDRVSSELGPEDRRKNEVLPNASIAEKVLESPPDYPSTPIMPAMIVAEIKNAVDTELAQDAFIDECLAERKMHPNLFAANSPRDGQQPSSLVERADSGTNLGETHESAPLPGQSIRASSDEFQADLFDPDREWYVCGPTGEQFGPASVKLIRKWIREMRVNTRTFVWRDDWTDWRIAGTVFPEFAKSSTNGSSVLPAQASQTPLNETPVLHIGESELATRRIHELRRRRSILWVTGMVVGCLAFAGLVILLLILVNV
ncbi:MAG TPA: GYF domain-containing protein [Pirellulaceae bacterium]|nr:GYF domain-containing protein [Pirellulaceae bacterium]HMO90659.1 GYF domain-containing protein [Pirellulaceae bacterium]HMP67762.1 GYF domain-containing protein [Pirellulaceae bacterium]